MFGSSPRRRAAWLALALAGAACEIPDFEGPQIQRPPATFRMDPSTHQDRRMFPERDVVHHDAWVEATRGDFSGILIDGHPGRIGRDHVEAARSAAMKAALGRRAEFGEIETLTVDGRTAWGWGERWSLESGEVDFIAFRAVVPYDTISYAIDFLTGDPALEARPDSLRTIVASFAVGATRWNLPLVALVAGAALLL
ncbi:MAG TPA: hypothetical protein VK849_05700, partial [Longimicrobiales bacterium]|nr:hypothetical protein [Longimicrobiales bacterium]